MVVFNVNAISQSIKEAGSKNVRILPMAGQAITEGDYQIEVNQSGNWVPIVSGIKKVIAEQIVSQALNKVICG